MRLVNLPNDDGIAPLAQACRYAKSVVVETLLHAQADVNAQGHNNGQTALMVASSLSRVVVVKLLLQHGADPALCIEHESRLVVRSALEAACSIRKSSAVIKVLASHDPALVSLASKADGCTALHRACAVGNGESVTALLHHKADPTVANNDGFEPLHLASMGGHDLVVRVLLARDAVNVDAHVRPPTRSGRYDYLSPLMLAAAGNHTDACTALLDAGAEVLYKRPRPFGDSALFSAARFGSVEATNLLLERGATIEDTDLKGRSSLHYAARGGFARVLLRLAAVAGPLANIQGTDGDTPLHAAVRNGHLECVKMLVCQPGLDPSLENQEGLTALALAQKADDQDLVEFLRTVMATGHRTGMLQTNDSPY